MAAKNNILRHKIIGHKKISQTCWEIFFALILLILFGLRKDARFDYIQLFFSEFGF